MARLRNLNSINKRILNTMKLKLLLTTMLVSIILESSAQESKQDFANVKMFEYEIGVGINFGHNNFDALSATTSPGLQLYGEIRLNIPQSAFDVSTQFMFATFNRTIEGYSNEIFYNRYRGIFLVFTDYNLRIWKNISPFVGIGFGTSFVDAELPTGSSKTLATSGNYVLNPRFGVELFNHLRVSFEYKWMLQQSVSKELSFFGVNLGYAFGGGLKKK